MAFALKRQTVGVDLATRPEGAVPTAAPVSPEYLALAEKLGVKAVDVLQARLLAFFAEAGIRVFPYDRVAAYLTGLWGEGEYLPAWGWAPLRTADVRKLTSNGAVDGTILPIAYREPVPMPVLETVDRVLEAFPDDDLHFYVSARAEEYRAKGDPFLALSAAGLPFFVIEVWDEPGFDRR